MPPKSRRSPPSPSSTNLTRTYLIAYNAVSLILWTTLLTRLLQTLTTTSLSNVYSTLGNFTQTTQSLALLEIGHSALGLVRSPISTTALQVASRIFILWGIVHPFHSGLQLGSSTLFSAAARNNQVAYTAMLGAWSVTEVVRYGYFVLFLSGGGNAARVPEWLRWLRYNGFWVLYPVGIGAEAWLVWKSLPMAEGADERYAWVLRGILVAYVPGAYVMFTHMMGQRRRVVRGKGRAVGG